MPAWFCTDPDTHQYCKPVNDHSWEFCELRHELKETSRGVVSIPIVCLSFVDLHDYPLDDIWEICSGYYESFEQMVETYGFREALCIMAECIFEQTSLSEVSAFRFDTDESAVQMIQERVRGG